jgi:hypothetical protein
MLIYKRKCKQCCTKGVKVEGRRWRWRCGGAELIQKLEEEKKNSKIDGDIIEKRE